MTHPIAALYAAQSASCNRPGTCRCTHPRSRHKPTRGACEWYDLAEGTGHCDCEEFTGPVDVVIRVNNRSWPLVYTLYGRVAHILEPNVSSDSSDPAMCGVCPFPLCWRGAGTPKENDKVKTLPLCARCEMLFERSRTPVKES